MGGQKPILQYSNTPLLQSEISGLDQIEHSLMAKIDHRHFIRSFAADKCALIIRAECKVRRSAADFET